MTLSVALTVGIIATVASWLNLSTTIAVLGALVAMQAILAVNDELPDQTTLLTIVPGSIGATLGAIFAARGYLADIVFLVVLFCAVIVRSRGPRWTAFGTIATVSYFFALFLGATVSQIPALIGAVVVASVVSYIVRFVILADRTQWIAERTVDAFEARIRLVVAAAQMLIEGHGGDADKQRLQVAVQRLNETAVSIEGRLGTDAGDAVRVVFDAELSAEHLASLAIRMYDAKVALPRALRLALTALARGQLDRASRVAARVPDDPASTAESRSLASAIAALSATVAGVTATTDALAVSSRPWGSIGVTQPPAFHQAVQVTIASALAIAVGEWLSPSRWYWAVLAAYFVFSGTASSGETLSRAWSRILGTAIGVVAGVLVGHFARGHPAIDTISIFVCLFLGVYMLRISNAIMLFFITALLALLYTELGRFSDGLLGIRLLETAIGSVFGGLAATLIFPTRTRDVVQASAQDALDGARDVVRSCVGRLIAAPTDELPLEAARVLEDRVQQFVARAQPVVSLPVLAGIGYELRRWIVSLSACSYYARSLARVVDRGPTPPGDIAATSLRRLEAGVIANIDAASLRVKNGSPDGIETVDNETLFEIIHAHAAAFGSRGSALEEATVLLERFDRALARLAHEDGSLGT